MKTHSSLLGADVSVPDIAHALAAATTIGGVVRLMQTMRIVCAPACPAPIAIPAERCKEVAAAWEIGDNGTLRIASATAVSEVLPHLVLRVARFVRSIQPARPLLLAILSSDARTLTLVTYAVDDVCHHVTLEPASGLPADIDVLQDIAASEAESGIGLFLRISNALDSRTVSTRFFRLVRTHRDAVSRAWSGIPKSRDADRDRLALLLLSRLMFLYFLQRQGHLLGDRHYLVNRVREYQRKACAPHGRHGPTRPLPRASFYRDVLSPLFFLALNTRPEHRSAAALHLGPLPYLNGGLFERTALEHACDVDLPDAVVISVFDELLERFRFTAADRGESAASGGASIDPEMLGHVFENLMDADRRGATGSFYTPPSMVEQLTRDALTVHLSNRTSINASRVRTVLTGKSDCGFEYGELRSLTQAVRETKVLDPACGSGAFLLGALAGLGNVRIAVGESASSARRDTVERCLFGVDLLDDAALLCSLRLWLALADSSDGGPPPPLPNLDRRIRQGDSLLDPIELLDARAGRDADARTSRDATLRRAIRSLVPLAEAYVNAEPEERIELRASISGIERQIAEGWIGGLDRRISRDLAEAHAGSDAQDLWGAEANGAATARQTHSRLIRRQRETKALLAQIGEGKSLPFFSFRVHFAEQPKFDVVLSNPPWVRSHQWPAAIGAAVRDRYAVCRDGGQVDLSALFVERSLKLLAPDGTLGMLLPAKMLRSLHGRGVRRLLLRDASLRSIDDYSLDQRAIFRADAFTTAIVASRRPADDGVIRVRMHRRGVEPLAFALRERDITRDADGGMPWLLAPPDVLAILTRLNAAGTPISNLRELHVQRGVVTGANDVLIAREFEYKLGDLARIRAEGYFTARSGAPTAAAARKFAAYVESGALRPLLRGSDVAAWSATPSSRLLVNDPPRRASYPRLERYFARHAASLRTRSGISAATPFGAIAGMSAHALGHKVVWRDIARTLQAAAVENAIHSDGRMVSVIPLNSVYYIGVADRDTALVLSAFLNSLPLRVFARTTAERAKDAHFRFFAWTVGMLPLPSEWSTRNRDTFIALSSDAHTAGGMSPADQALLDSMVGSAFGLSAEELAVLARFDAWLSGQA